MKIGNQPWRASLIYYAFDLEAYRGQYKFIWERLELSIDSLKITALKCEV